MTPTADLGLSTHVLNTSNGLPAADMLIRLEMLEGTTWREASTARTDADGRARELSPSALRTGDYRLTFATGAWFTERGVECFFPTVTIEFRVSDPKRHHHVPLLLSPFGYSTYRGS